MVYGAKKLIPEIRADPSQSRARHSDHGRGACGMDDGALVTGGAASKAAAGRRSARAWREYGPILAVDLPSEQWQVIAGAYLYVDKLNAFSVEPGIKITAEISAGLKPILQRITDARKALASLYEESHHQRPRP
jgi:hypothetical protein